MIYSLVELDEYSGKKTTVYSLLDEEEETLFDKFVQENEGNHLAEVQDITTRLIEMANNTGIKKSFLKMNEGNPGDGICALYDKPNSKLRVYLIWYGPDLIILGNGGYKDKSIRAFQEDDKLTKENYLLREIVKKITEKMKEKEIWIASDEEGSYFDWHDNDDFKIEI